MKEDILLKIADTMILKSPKKIEGTNDKLLVLEECTLALGDLTIEQLQSGRLKYARMENSFGIDTGKFRELCLSGKSCKPAKQYISQSEPDDIPLCNRDLNGKSCRMIIEKLNLPEMLKQKDFESFKKNRAAIEASRKQKFPKVKNAVI